MLAQVAVQGSQRFVEHQQAGIGGKRPRQGHALLLAARKIRDPPILETGQVDFIQGADHPSMNFLLRQVQHL